MSNELTQGLEWAMGKVMRKHPEIVSLVEKLYNEPWEHIAGKWRKRSADKSMLLTVDIDKLSARIDFFQVD